MGDGALMDGIDGEEVESIDDCVETGDDDVAQVNAAAEHSAESDNRGYRIR
jgi:hypothetical protein